QRSIACWPQLVIRSSFICRPNKASSINSSSESP
ncbi:hypothetical protein D047_0069B, partial [Vibrio parahaemolyticus VPTS-2010_2]